MTRMTQLEYIRAMVAMHPDGRADLFSWTELLAIMEERQVLREKEITERLGPDAAQADADSLAAEVAEWRDEQATRESVRPL